METVHCASGSRPLKVSSVHTPAAVLLLPPLSIMMYDALAPGAKGGGVSGLGGGGGEQLSGIRSSMTVDPTTCCAMTPPQWPPPFKLMR